MPKRKSPSKKPADDEHASLRAVVPFQSYGEWLTWKRQQQEANAYVADAYDDIFPDSESDPVGISELHRFESSLVEEAIPDVIPTIEGASKEQYETIVKQLASVIAAPIWGIEVDIDRLGKRVDPQKMMHADAIALLLSNLRVQERFPVFFEEWKRVRAALLIEGTQLASPKRRTSAEDTVTSMFCRWTFWILKNHSKLTNQDIRRIQKQLYTHFLNAANDRQNCWRCQYVINGEDARASQPKYQAGILKEGWDVTLDHHKNFNAAGNLIERTDRPGHYDCRYRRSSGRRGASHCENGNICRYVDDKIDAWYKHASPDLLKPPQAE